MFEEYGHAQTMVLALFANMGLGVVGSFRPHECYHDALWYCKFIIDTNSALKLKKVTVSLLCARGNDRTIKLWEYRLVQTPNIGVPLPTHEQNDPVPANL